MTNSDMCQTILLIDDEESVRAAVEAGLEAIGGFTVESAFDGRTGLEMIERLRPDILMLDLLLPGIDGFEVLKELRSRPGVFRPGRIVVMTAHSDPMPASALHQLGADSLLSKPFQLADLHAAVVPEVA